MRHVYSAKTTPSFPSLFQELLALKRIALAQQDIQDTLDLIARIDKAAAEGSPAQS
jgi:hypothetical protein